MPDDTLDPHIPVSILGDDRLDRYAAGDLSEAEREALEEEAKAEPLLAAALVAFAPLSDEVFERAVSHARDRYSRGLPRWASLVQPVCALAAALMLAVVFWPRGPVLPTYGAPTVVKSTTRSSAAEPTARQVYRFDPGDPIRIQLAPATRPPVAPQVLVYLDGWFPSDRLSVEPDLVTQYGSVLLQGTIGVAPWDLASGRHTLGIAVGPAWASPPWWGEPSDAWQRFPVELIVP